MKMLLLLYRHSLDAEVRTLLQELRVRAFTEAPKVFGIGEAGQAHGTFEWPGYNSLILSAMEDDQAKLVIDAVQTFRNRLAKEQRGAKIPMRMFALPCDQVV